MLRTTSSTMAKFASRSRQQLLLCPLSSANNNSPSTSTTASSSTVVLPPLSTTTRNMTILSKESAIEFKKQNYSSRMAESQTQRPVSPHVTIYSFPVCALSSITTRVTGCALSFGGAGLGLVEIIGGNGAALELMSTIGGGCYGARRTYT